MRQTLFILALTSCLLGCASTEPKPATFDVAPGTYTAAFDAAHEVLRSMRFELDRVDARAGVITTHDKHSAGIASLWDREQSTLGQEWEDFTNEQFRSVRILFEPVGAPSPPSQRSRTAPPPPAEDLRTFEGEITGTVVVVLLRRSRPGWRIDTTSIRLSTFTRDPLGGPRRTLVPIARDERLEGRLAAEITKRATESP